MAEVKGQGDASSSMNIAPTTAAIATMTTTTTTTAPNTTTNASKLSARSALPSDKVRLDVLLITGQRRNFDFDPKSSIKDVRQLLWTEWPQDWPPRPISSSAIRILHLGHILEDKVILSQSESASGASSAREMPIGKSTVVHLLLRQEPTKADGGDEESLKKPSHDTPGCCGCTIC